MHTPTSPSPSLTSRTLTTPLLSLLLLSLLLLLLLLPYLPPSQALKTTVMEQDLNKANLKSSTATSGSILTTFPARSLLECATSCALLTPCWALTFSPGQKGPSSQSPPLHSCSCYSTGTLALPLSAPAPAARTYAVKGCVEAACPEIPTTTPEIPTTTPEIPTTTPEIPTTTPEIPTTTPEIPTTTTKIPTTTPAECSQPPNFSGLSHYPAKTKYYTNDQVTYQCNDESDGGGTGLHVCDISGTWRRKATMPECD